jgi:predicted GIY-YIG superfamily endonuclease
MKLDRESVRQLGDITNPCTYLISNNDTGESYVGSTYQIKRRLRDHLNSLEKQKHHNSRLQKTFNNTTNFEVAIVELETKQQAVDLENSIIEEHWGNPFFLNEAYTSDRFRSNVTVSAETRKKQSESAKRYYAKGNFAPNKGTKLTDEQKEVLRHKAIEQWSDGELRILASNLAKQRFEDPGERARASIKTSEYFSNQDARDNLSAKKKQYYKDNPTSLLRMSEARKQYIEDNPEFLEALKQSSLKQWENPEYRSKIQKKSDG